MVRLLCPKFCLVGQTRCAPQKCESFTIASSPGVLVDIYNVASGKVTQEAALTQWPLSHPMDVLVKMTSPSSDVNGDKVSLGGR